MMKIHIFRVRDLCWNKILCYAGSMTCDVHIWMSGFVGEGVGSGSALVVKSHNSKQFSYDKNCSGSNSVIIATIQYHMFDVKV